MTNEINKKKTSKRKFLGPLIVLTFFSICAYVFTRPAGPDTFPTESEGYIKAIHFVRGNLKSPKSADFPYKGYQHNCSEKDSMFEYNSYVDATNSLNAEIRSNWYIKMKYLGNKQWALLDIKID